MWSSLETPQVFNTLIGIVIAVSAGLGFWTGYQIGRSSSPTMMLQLGPGTYVVAPDGRIVPAPQQQK